MTSAKEKEWLRIIMIILYRTSKNTNAIISFVLLLLFYAKSRKSDVGT